MRRIELGVSSEIRPKSETFELLLKSCHVKALPEKAVEILSRMLDLGMDPSTTSIRHIQDAISIGQVWDRKLRRKRDDGVHGGRRPDGPGAVRSGDERVSALTLADLRPADPVPQTMGRRT